jgi:5-methylcytosine-specific restriction endonuclease McrA
MPSRYRVDPSGYGLVLYALDRATPKIAEAAPAVRALLARRDGHLCWLCSDPIAPGRDDVRGSDPAAESVDHVLARSWGGGSELANLRLAHRGCNQERDLWQRHYGAIVWWMLHLRSVDSRQGADELADAA